MISLGLGKTVIIGVKLIQLRGLAYTAPDRLLRFGGYKSALRCERPNCP